MRTKELLRKYKIKPKKSWSQYFLTSKSVIHTMASFAEGVVLEIGPGLGFITQELAKRADKVIAIEKDRKLVKVLQKEYDFDNVEIIQADATEIELPAFDRVISNLPYHVSSQLTFKLLDHSFDIGVLSYQKEFAQRLQEVESPNVSRLSIMAQVKAECRILQYVPRGCYYPVPKTDCALVKMVPHKKFTTDSFFDQVVRGLYSHKRKTVKNALLSSADLTGLTKEVVQGLQIPCAEKRVWSLSLEEVLKLADILRTRVEKPQCSQF